MMSEEQNQTSTVEGQSEFTAVVMRPEEAILFLRKHSAWLDESWSRSPEGRDYKKRFDAAIDALMLHNGANQW